MTNPPAVLPGCITPPWVSTPMAGDWTDEQNDAIVADYFAMLAADIVARSYSKAEHNRRL